MHHGHRLRRRARQARAARRLPPRGRRPRAARRCCCRCTAAAGSIGDKEHQGIPLMLHMAARGWVCVAINYRLSPRDAFPAHLVDVKRAIAWIREHGAEYGARPGVPRGHRRLGGRPPRGARRAHPERPGVPARLRGRRHHACRRRCRTTASTTSPARPAPQAPSRCATGSSARGCCSRTRARDLDGVREGLPAAAGQRRRAAVLRASTARSDTLVDGRPGAARSSRALRERLAAAGRLRRAARRPARLRRVPVDPVSAHVVRGVDRFLRFTYDALGRAGPPHDRHARGPARQGAGRQGLHARGRGRRCCTDVALRAPAARPGARGRHLLRQVRDLPRRRRARASAAPSSPSTTTAARRRTRPAGSTTTPTLVDPRVRPDGHAAGVPAHHRATPASRTRWSPSSAARTTVSALWRTPLALLFIDGGHAEEHASNDYTGWAPLGGARRRAGDPRRVPRPRGRRPAAVPRLPAGARERRLRARPTALGSMRVLTPRRAATPATRSADVRSRTPAPSSAEVRRPASVPRE